jgi:penicillin-binding protein 1C
VRYRTALASSLNISAVKVLLVAGGPAALHERLRLCGLTTLDRPPEIYGLGLTLGNCEARLLEIANAYAALARLGEFRPWRVLADTPTSSRHVARPEFVWQIADILSDNSARTLSFGMNSALRFPYPIACKTGTSTDFRDNWTIGFTPEFTVGVWVGNFDGSPMREVSGVTGAGPIFHAIFDHLHATRGTSWYRTPPEIVERSVHPLTGKLVAGNAPRAVREKFVVGHFPPNESPGDYDSAGSAKLGPEYAQWLASGENDLADRTALGTGAALRIISPLPGSVFVIDPDIPSSRLIPLSIAGTERVNWQSDSLELCEEGGRIVARASEGEHRIIAIERESGRTAETWISVRSL